MMNIWWKKLIFLNLLIGGIVYGGYAFSGPSAVKGEFHGNCSFCHIRQNNTAVLPLWNPDIRGQNSQRGQNPELRQTINSSKVCLSCHDGTIGSDQAISLGEEAKAALTVDLGRSHPVSVDYSASFSRKRRNLRHPSTLGDVKLFDGKVECGTCHDIHASFRLRASKRTLCTSCHNL